MIPDPFLEEEIDTRPVYMEPALVASYSTSLVIENFDHRENKVYSLGLSQLLVFKADAMVTNVYALFSLDQLNAIVNHLVLQTDFCMHFSLSHEWHPQGVGLLHKGWGFFLGRTCSTGCKRGLKLGQGEGWSCRSGGGVAT